MTYSDREFVTRQYRDASKLDARIALHRTGAEEFGRRKVELEQRLERALASHGTINIIKDTGMFVARK